ncbi:MAG: FAD-binding oxidoreductase [Gammaproteobacteria bacterium]|nr:FAD-binding oxidoreductase [Gammaproteobacteria bacterium]NIR83813.1 FAD-binding oxidoreductase [Gammaproteobacteria bacterium]NIR88230.1 FAD-binding oxidoreductase [Gammaproteobacteria bacterium]NIU05139.1 FAD-binding oxidoreductase [Gammaproteobacteria bacterium]NIV51976.1 FAD-dependent oxidoreductase [Gammaproteobacteria bacterium]
MNPVNRKTVDILIVGAGAYGLSAAWWMAQRREGHKILVLDEGEFASGGTGRNGAGFRMQWGLEFNIRLNQESIRFFEEACERLDYPDGIDLKQGGYLLLAHSREMFEGFQSNHRRQRELGVPSEILDTDDCLRLAPALNPDGVVGGSFCHKDGSASPFLWLDALLRAARREGAEVRYRTRVRSLRSAGRAFAVDTTEGVIAASRVLVCTDWAAPQLLRTVGVDLPITGMPKEGLVTEAWKPHIGPMLISFRHDMALNQMARGNIVAIVSRERPEGDDIASTPDFLPFAATRLLDLVPSLAPVRVLRTWGGVISKTPDMQAVLGETDVPGLFVAVSAYKGFMTSPAVGRIMAELVLDGHSNDPAAALLSPSRFDRGDLVPEPLTV